MSDRSLLLPDRALQMMLGSLLNRSRRSANYQQWPGAARLITLDVGSGIAAVLPNSVITTVLTLPLDAGTWLILAGLYTQDVTAIGGLGGKYEYDAWINIPGESPFRTSTNQAASYLTTHTATTFSRRATLATAGSVFTSLRPTASATAVGAGFAYILAIGA